MPDPFAPDAKTEAIVMLPSSWHLQIGNTRRHSPPVRQDVSTSEQRGLDRHSPLRRQLYQFARPGRWPRPIIIPASPPPKERVRGRTEFSMNPYDYSTYTLPVVTRERVYEKQHRPVRGILTTMLLAVLMFLLVHQAVQTFTVSGMSMEPSLHNGQVVLVDKWTYLFRQPVRGDVVVFHAPPAPNQDYIKRIIAVPGDVVSVTNGMPTVDGVMLKESYVSPLHEGRSPSDKPVNNLIVPPGEFFVMGDDRQISFDSRSWGLLPQKNIIGRAVMVIWPVGDANGGGLPDPSSNFDQLPGS